jgi:hypothetical protein
VWTPKGFDWVYRKFIAEDRPVGYEAIRAMPNENRHLREDFYESLKHSYDEKFYQQEVLGEYLNQTGGLVYTAFSRKDNVKNLRVDLCRPLLWALDFNVDPLSSLIVQIADGAARVVDEIVLRNASTPEACAEFLKRFPNHRAGVTVFGDASGSAQQTSGNTDYGMVREYFNAYSTTKPALKVPKANPSVRERVNLVNSLLKSAAGNVAVTIDPKCVELIKDLEQVAYKGDTGTIDKERDRLRTHTSDALGYVLWQLCKSELTVGERAESLRLG